MVQKVIPKNAILIPNQAERVFQGVVYDVYQWPQQLFDGSTATFEMLRRADTVSAICIVDGELLVLKDIQPHRGLRATFPGGRAEETEDRLAAVQREVHEETGYAFKNWKLLEVHQPHTKIEWFVYIYLAWDGKRETDSHVDAGEKITVELLPFDEVRSLAAESVGYLGDSLEILDAAKNIDGLLTLPEFVGQTVER